MFRMKHNGSITDQNGYRWLYDVEDIDSDLICFNVEEEQAKRLCASSNYFENLLDVCKNIINGTVDTGSVKTLLGEIQSKL